ncbi:hypothetical protein [Duganella fentianensis]|uniref:hypothetical protein n=1 Tax=Duganella fentianensis TaxID=2692177 RepID=UPI0032B1B4EF
MIELILAIDYMVFNNRTISVLVILDILTVFNASMFTMLAVKLASIYRQGRRIEIAIAKAKASFSE